MKSLENVARTDSQNSEKRNIFGAGWIVSCLAALPAVVTAIQCHSTAAQMTPHALLAPSLLYGFVLWYWWAAVAMVLWSVGRRWSALWVISWKNGLLQLAGGGLIAFLHLEALQTTILLMIWRWPYLDTIGYRKLVFLSSERLALELLLYVLAWAASAAIYMQIVAQKEKLKTAELKQQLSSSHLQALQMQLEPHFLFNTLNAITTLVKLGRHEEAIETLFHLNSILKSTLVQSTPQKVSIAQELAVVENYLAIEQVRFADRLRVEMKIDPAALNGLVPCFLLQPIVENAIRHGISQCEDNGVIFASIEREGNRLHLTVRDNGPGLLSKPLEPGHGIGLKNTEDRLAHFYPEVYRLTAKPGKTGGFEVFIVIPYEQAFA